ncbi:hypothetical protein EDM68_02490 [Candidatus Uhrbacteria bacterium]|nr:MAG: hypothetical protein EDM68_02490 [Candidatus Uhrbacteria bacterium]
MPLQAWINKSLASFALAALVTGQPVPATMAPNVDPAVMVAVSAEQNANETTPANTPTVQDVLLHVCEERGYGEDCAKTLLGMLWTESSNRSTVIGDGGRARGYFQIHYRLHNISIDCAEDLVCSANWSLSYLEKNHYPKYVNYAIQCHNSCNAGNGYVGKVKRYAAQFWNQPLAIEQEAPIRLAMK